MRDLTGYSEDELSLNVMNEEYFYNERHRIAYLRALIDAEFIYTDEQMKVLLEDLSSDAEENR